MTVAEAVPVALGCPELEGLHLWVSVHSIYVTVQPETEAPTDRPGEQTQVGEKTYPTQTAKGVPMNGQSPEVVAVMAGDTKGRRNDHLDLANLGFESGDDTCLPRADLAAVSASVVIGPDEWAACLCRRANVISA